MNNINFDYSLPDYNERTKLICSLNKSYPFIRYHTVAKSLCSRNIQSIEIGNSLDKVLLIGAFHGMEWLTSLLLIHFVKNVSEAISSNQSISGINVTRFFKHRGLVVIPCINPDGVEICIHGANAAKQFKELVVSISNEDTSDWQANARGVDLNHNFDAEWEALHSLELESGIWGPAKTRYGGPHPESEPETKFLTEFCRTHSFRQALAFHSQGEEIYWSFSDVTPFRSKAIATIFESTSGYKATEPDGLAVGGGFKDWFMTEFKKPAFTIEIGKGKNPLPLSDLPEIYYKLEKMLLLSLIL